MYFQIYLNAFLCACFITAWLPFGQIPSVQSDFPETWRCKGESSKVQISAALSVPQCEDMMHGALLILKKKEPFREIFLVNFSLSQWCIPLTQWALALHVLFFYNGCSPLNKALLLAVLKTCITADSKIIVLGGWRERARYLWIK